MLPDIDIAIIGVGRWGANLLRVLTQMPRVRVRAVCDIDASRLAECLALPGLGEALLTRDSSAVMQLSGLRAVVIASPPESHVSLGLSALTEGLDVFVEKPLGPSAAEAKRLTETAEHRGAILMVGHILEYHPHLRGLRRLVRAGILGPIRRLESERHGCVPDDAWWALAPHDLGLARTFLGAARDLSAEQLHNGVVAVEIRMQDGNALIRVSKDSAARVRRISLVGRDARAIFDDSGCPSLSIVPNTPGVSAVPYATLAESVVAEGARCPEPLRVELEAFVDAVVTRRSPVTDGRYGLDVVELLEAADRSRASGGTCVSCRPSARPSRSARAAAFSAEAATTDG